MHNPMPNRHLAWALLLAPLIGGYSAIAQEPMVIIDEQSEPAADRESDARAPAFGFNATALLDQVPDPEVALASAERGLREAIESSNQAEAKFHRRMIDRLTAMRANRQIELTLEQAILKALGYSYVIDTVAFNPAIERTRVVEAESGFDAVFFTNVNKTKQDRPTGSQLAAGDLDSFLLSSGVRKVLPTGAQVSASYNLSRTKTSLSFQQLNPEYFSTTDLQLRQPLLRGFGTDVNLAQIRVARNNEHISRFEFERQVRDLVQQVEQVYWQLAFARRNVVLTARLLAEFEAIYDYLVARSQLDVTEVQLNATRSRLETSTSDFFGIRQEVRNIEDQLIALMNDPELTLAGDFELIPADVPFPVYYQPSEVAEVSVALDHRRELKEQELRIKNARIGLVQAKSGTLPRLDLVLGTTYSGIGGNADMSFDGMTTARNIDYQVQVELEVPIGNRGPRAVHARSKLLHDQAVSQMKSQIENVILEVNTAVRNLQTVLEQIEPSFESVVATEQEVRSIVARAERKDINTLTTELNARERLAANRRALLNSLIGAMNAHTELEKVKGTLLDYNQIVVEPESPGP